MKMAFDEFAKLTARVYVGTYAKYDSGSIAGEWLDLEKYANKESFIEACRALHNDESDPELMFQDFEGFPASYYSESSIDDSLWYWLELEDDDKELLTIYQTAVDEKGDIEEARACFHGVHDSAADFAANWFEETGEADKIPESLRCHIDWNGVARDFGYDGWIFHRHNGSVYVFGPG